MSDQLGQQIQVYIRCRPLKTNERPIVDLTRNEVQILDGKKFWFDHVFDQESSQDEVYNTAARPLIEQVFDGYNCTVFAYGQTGTGKTYTMEGIIPLAIEDIFRTLQRNHKESQTSIRVSFLELYNEEAYDLLADDLSKLKIFDDIHRKGSVQGLKEVSMNSINDIFEVLEQGNAKRRTNATLLNACSSRSHTIFSISLQVKESHVIKMGKLNLVDLAGSESIARSGAKDKMAREAGNINQSLLTLGRVITALTEERPHIPYRESKLTRILQDSLGGRTRSTMIATISPADSDCTTTLSTLEYASRARYIINQPEVNRQVLQKKQSFDEMDLEIRVRNEVAAEFKREIDKMRQSYEAHSSTMQKELEDIIKNLRAELKQKEDQLQQMNEGIVKNLRDELKDKNDKLLEMELKEDIIKKLRAEIKDKDNQVHEMKLELKICDNLVNSLQKENMTLRESVKPAPLEKQPDKFEDYLNMTFDGGDELTQASTKKKKKVVKKRILNPTIMLSGKKKKLDNTQADVELSPLLTETTRVTRSRATKRKLDL